MGLTQSGMQPFELNGSYAVCNGELYGFQRQRVELEAKGYTFNSDSDCEILRPMYREHGVKMFAMLDAEFACILCDSQTEEFIAARDPIGIRPLYYGYSGDGTIVFVSEPKNLVGLVADAKVGFLLSGGLEPVIHLLGTFDITTIRASIGMYLVCKAIHEQTDIRVLLTGEISDELFGYKYTDLAPSGAAFQSETEKRLRELHMYDVLRADRCISERPECPSAIWTS